MSNPRTPKTPTLGLDPELLEIIVCPECHGDLLPVEGSATQEPGEGAKSHDDGSHGGELVCQGCGLAYPVTDGIPVLLVDEARRP